MRETELRVYIARVSNVLLAFFFVHFYHIHLTPNAICAPCASETKDDHIMILTNTKS